jgi:hypothetical protein
MTIFPLAIDGAIFTEIPATYILMQNYTNPFNPSTNILFGLPKAVDV